MFVHGNAVGIPFMAVALESKEGNLCCQISTLPPDVLTWLILNTGHDLVLQDALLILR